MFGGGSHAVSRGCRVSTETSTSWRLEIRNYYLQICEFGGYGGGGRGWGPGAGGPGGRGGGCREKSIVEIIFYVAGREETIHFLQSKVLQPLGITIASHS